MATRSKKNRRKAQREAKAKGAVAQAQHVIYDASGDDLVISEASETEFAEAGRGYLIYDTIRMPGGGEITLTYPEDDPDADPNDPLAPDYYCEPSGSTAGSPGPRDTRDQVADRPLMDKPEPMDVESGDGGRFSRFETRLMWCLLRLLLENPNYPTPAAPSDPQKLWQLLFTYFEFLVADNAGDECYSHAANLWMDCDWDELYPAALEAWAGDGR